MPETAPPEVSKVGEVTVITLGPAYDYVYDTTVQELHSLLDVAADANPPLLVVDISHTKHFGSRDSQQTL